MSIRFLKITTNRLFKSADNADTRIKQSNKTASNVGKTLKQQSIFKKQSISKRQNIYQKRQDGIRRRQQKDLFEAIGVKGAVRGVGKAVTRSTKGFLGKILDSIATVMVGWTIINLPKIVILTKELGSRIMKVTGILSNFMENTYTILQEFGTLTSELVRSLLAFDFSNMGRQIDTSMAKVQESFNRMQIDFFRSLEILTEPIDFGIEDQGPQEMEPGLPGGIVTGGTSDFWTLVAVASREDADAQGQADVAQSIYNRAASGAYGTSSIRAIILRKQQYQPTWDYPQKGKYGTPNVEWYNIKDAESAAKASGFSVATIKGVAANLLNPSLQKKAAEFVQGRTDFKGYEVAGSIQRKSGDNYFGWEYTYRGTQVAGVPQFGAQVTPSPTKLGTTPLISGDVLTQSIGRGVKDIRIGDVMGAPRGGGRKHAGIDIQCPSGTWIALRVDCEWVGYDYDRNGYGHVLDVWVPSYGVQLRFGHLLSKPTAFTTMKAGVSFAQVGSSGRSTGPHIHFEYTRTKGKMAGGSDSDPSPYVPLLLLTNRPNTATFNIPRKPTPAQVSAATQEQKTRVAENITPERKDKTLIVTAPPQLQQSMMMPSGGSSHESQIIIAGNGLNSLIKNKMLLDLAYT